MQLTSNFWQSLFKISQVEIKLLSTYHLQMDGQIERVNQVLEHYLQCTINYHKDNWVDFLPLAEFAYNNTFHESIKQTLFFANYGHHARFDQYNFNVVKNPATIDLANQSLEIHKEMKTRLIETQKK